jgi:probable HAF family extracellular repeat protein
MPAMNRISPLIALPLLLDPFAVQAGTMPSYNITVIGPAGSTATALNDAGQVVGNYQSNGTYGFLYSDGSFTSIGASDGYTFAKAINNAGVVAGQTESPSGTVAFKYSNGTMQTFSAWDGGLRGTTVANGINNAGQLVGYASQIGPSRIYLDANGVAMPFVAIHGYFSYATAINNSGAVTASVFADPTSPRHGWASINGVSTDLGTLGGDWSARQESTMPDRSSVRQISRQAITTTMRFFTQAAS